MAAGWHDSKRLLHLPAELQPCIAHVLDGQLLHAALAHGHAAKVHCRRQLQLAGWQHRTQRHCDAAGACEQLQLIGVCLPRAGPERNLQQEATAVA